MYLGPVDDDREVRPARVLSRRETVASPTPAAAAAPPATGLDRLLLRHQYLA